MCADSRDVVNRRAGTLASRPSLAFWIQWWRWGFKLWEILLVATAEELGGLQGYTLLPWRSRSQGQEVTSPSGWGWFRSYIWGVGSNQGRWRLTDSCANNHQLERIAWRWLQPSGSDPSCAWAGSALGKTHARRGAAPAWGYGTKEICSLSRRWQRIKITMWVSAN